MKLEDKYFLQAVEQRMRREYISPQLYQAEQDLTALPAEVDFPARVIQAMCDVMMRKLRVYRADINNRAALLDLVALCQALELCGYRAHADLGRRPLVQATRIDVLQKREDPNGE